MRKQLLMFVAVLLLATASAARAQQSTKPSANEPDFSKVTADAQVTTVLKSVRSTGKINDRDLQTLVTRLQDTKIAATTRVQYFVPLNFLKTATEPQKVKINALMKSLLQTDDAKNDSYGLIKGFALNFVAGRTKTPAQFEPEVRKLLKDSRPRVVSQAEEALGVIRQGDRGAIRTPIQ